MGKCQRNLRTRKEVRFYRKAGCIAVKTAIELVSGNRKIKTGGKTKILKGERKRKEEFPLKLFSFPEKVPNTCRSPPFTGLSTLIFFAVSV